MGNYRFKTIIACLVFVLILLPGCVDKNDSASGKIGGDFTLQDLNGNNVSLSDYRGKVVLLEFWATWCPPCRASVPALEKLHTSYKDKGLAILAISMDEGGWSSVQSFAKDYGITYTVLKGTNEVMSKYRVRVIPMTFLIDKQGNVSPKSLAGFGREDELEKEIKALL